MSLRALGGGIKQSFQVKRIWFQPTHSIPCISSLHPRVLANVYKPGGSTVQSPHWRCPEGWPPVEGKWQTVKIHDLQGPQMKSYTSNTPPSSSALTPLQLPAPDLSRSCVLERVMIPVEQLRIGIRWRKISQMICRRKCGLDCLGIHQRHPGKNKQMCRRIANRQECLFKELQSSFLDNLPSLVATSF